MEDSVISPVSSVTRARRLDDVLPAGSTRVADLVELSRRGLSQMHQGLKFVQTVRGTRTSAGSVLRGEGENLRYAAITALGAALLPIDLQREMLGGATAVELTATVVEQARTHPDTGAIALAAWAAAEVDDTHVPALFDRLQHVFDSAAPVTTVEAAWTVTAALAARKYGDTAALTDQVASLLATAQHPSGLFPHVIPADSQSRMRSHVGCFADQVYPIQALARLALATGNAAALDAANACAAQICAVQGSAGQWWWHYDARTGGVVEEFPVYSVHQHAMAPMALFDLAGAGGDDHLAEIALGLDWLRSHPEVMSGLIDAEHGVVWRKVGRREPAKAVRKFNAVSTSVRAGLRMPLPDKLFPATRIDYECRPYELGWLLYAWLTGNPDLRNNEL